MEGFSFFVGVRLLVVFVRWWFSFVWFRVFEGVVEDVSFSLLEVLVIS